MPFTAVILFLWSWGLDFGERIFWGFGTGIFLDSIYPDFFGVYVVAFFVLALLIGLLRSRLSDTGPFLTKQVGVFFYLPLFILLISYLPLVFMFFQGMSSSWVSPPLIKVFLAMFLWSLFFIVLWGGFTRLGSFLIRG